MYRDCVYCSAFVILSRASNPNAAAIMLLLWSKLKDYIKLLKCRSATYLFKDISCSFSKQAFNESFTHLFFVNNALSSGSAKLLNGFALYNNTIPYLEYQKNYITLVNVYVDLLVFTRIAGTS